MLKISKQENVKFDCKYAIMRLYVMARVFVYQEILDNVVEFGTTFRNVRLSFCKVIFEFLMSLKTGFGNSLR